MGDVAEVRIARRTGFCYGVREAIDDARLAAAEGKRTHTLGQVVHNEGVIDDLRAHGIRTVESSTRSKQGAAVVIRAHGVTPEVMARAEARGLDVIDGTCSWVTRSRRSWPGWSRTATPSCSWARPTTRRSWACWASPRTPSSWTRRRTGSASRAASGWRSSARAPSRPGSSSGWPRFMVSRAHELKIVNTVCPVTIRRQEDTTELARQVDLVVVVGGRNSANTKELTRLVGIVGKPAVQIEQRARPGRMRRRFAGRRVVGVTGGTSTPIEDLEEVAERIYELAGTPDAQARAASWPAPRSPPVAEPAYRSTLARTARACGRCASPQPAGAA